MDALIRQIQLHDHAHILVKSSNERLGAWGYGEQSQGRDLVNDNVYDKYILLRVACINITTSSLKLKSA